MATRLNQVALSVRDRERSRQFYESAFGLVCVGETDAFEGEATEAVQGLPDVSSEVYWLMDDREFFQLELFQFERPVPRDHAGQREPWDIGYSRIAFEVADLETARANCEKAGATDIGATRRIGEREYFCAKDPDGILIEVGDAESPLAPGQVSRLVGVGVSVPDLELARQSFGEALGLPVIAGEPEDKGTLWGEEGADKEMLRLDGGTVWVEFSAYRSPVPRPRPADYRISDIGILNVAVGYRSSREMRAMYRRLVDAGYDPNAEPQGVRGLVQITYLNDPQGLSVELLMLHRMMDGVFGFRPARGLDRVLMRILRAAA